MLIKRFASGKRGRGWQSATKETLISFYKPAGKHLRNAAGKAKCEAKKTSKNKRKRHKKQSMKKCVTDRVMGYPGGSLVAPSRAVVGLIK